MDMKVLRVPTIIPFRIVLASVEDDTMKSSLLPAPSALALPGRSRAGQERPADPLRVQRRWSEASTWRATHSGSRRPGPHSARPHSVVYDVSRISDPLGPHRER